VPIVFGTASRRVLNHFQPRHPQNAGHQRQPKILGLLDGIVDFFNQGPGLVLPEHRKFLQLQRFCLRLDIAGRSLLG